VSYLLRFSIDREMLRELITMFVTGLQMILIMMIMETMHIYCGMKLPSLAEARCE
jgi:hypothetical protein